MLRPFVTFLVVSTLACQGASDAPDAGIPADNRETATADAGTGLDALPLPDGGHGLDEQPLEGLWHFGDDSVTVTATTTEDRRSYVMRSSHPMRDDGPQERRFAEQAGDPVLRSGVLLTDALFALAVEEARQNAVEQISDSAFEDALDCSCYQTGALWNWVWTRDIAYATELGLAWLDPERAANSLLFKLSTLKAGGQLQIVQDTGTGGSWPVSTDRVTWARGAMAVLRRMDHPELRTAAIEAMRNSAEIDRRYAFDVRDGLYFGETSFLDWRAQSYGPSTATNVVEIAMTKSLSTNLNHLYMRRALEELTGEDHGSSQLATAVDAAFFDGSAYRSFLGGPLQPMPVEQQDLLATSLAVIDLGTHPEALANYPFGSMGPPVIWPQQQQIPIYHNRAIWPFVTAYAVLAARASENGAVFSAGLDSLIRGAAINLSNMENLELVSGANWLEDGDFSGPIINSPRQLWSVAGFIGVVVEGVFGLRSEEGRISADPILPDGPWFEAGAELRIGGFVARIGDQKLPSGAISHFEATDWHDLFGARVPEVRLEGTGETVALTFSGEPGASFDVYKDGSMVAENATSPWRDRSPHTACYSVVARLRLPSHPSPPQCWWGDQYSRVQSVYAEDFQATGGVWSTDHGRPHYGMWGAPDHRLSLQVVPRWGGQHLLQLVYGNGSGDIATGVTAAVKWLRVRDDQGELIAEGPITMPHRSAWDDWGDSTFLPALLEAGRQYSIEIVDGFNMSYLDHYRAYRGARGGGDRASNDVNIAELKLLHLR